MAKKRPNRSASPKAIQQSLWDEIADSPEPELATPHGEEGNTARGKPARPQVSRPVESGPAEAKATAPSVGVETQTVVGRGTRRLEELLLGEVERLVGEAPGSGLPDFEVGPIRIVVPSTSLRTHLLGALTRRCRRPLLGVVCQTHHSLARDVLERAGIHTATSGDLTALLARRYAHNESALARRLGHLHDGLGAVVGTVRDFIDAGLDPAHVDPLLDLLASEGASVASYAEVERAGAVLRVAARALAGHEEIGVLPASGTVQRANDCLKTLGPDALPTRAVLIYGYADATGVTTEFLQTLLSAFRGSLFVDRPQDPAERDSIDRGFRVSERFLERFAGAATSSDSEEPQAQVATELSLETDVSAFRALGTDAECREIAARCRALIDAGTAPEAIGVVARNLTGYAVPLRRHFGRLGVPFSGVGPHGPPDPLARRAEGLLELLRDQDRLKLDRWFEIVDQAALAAPRADLKLALAAAGQTRLQDLSQLDAERLSQGRSHLPLPARLGILEDGEPDAGRSRATRRRLSKEALLGEQRRARQVLKLLVETAPLARWLESVPEILQHGLAWPPVEIERITDAIRQGVDRLPEELTLRHHEFSVLVERPIRETADRSLGGSGGGVQLLDVTESRGRTYDELFLVGMNRGVFPRTIQPDPLLPDSIRELMALSGHGLLPDLPIKRAGFDEERYLFAQLLSCSPRVTLSWLETDADGRPAPPSPLVERLQWSHRLDVALDLVSEPYARERAAVRSGWERGVEVALRTDRAALKALLPSLFVNTAADDEGRGQRWAAARLAVLAEQAPTPGSPAWNQLGPYYGFVGPAAADDPRRTRDVFVTTLERLARCPWNAFLEKVLSLEAYPDPFDVLPRVDPLRIGALIHRVLERAVLRLWEALPEDARPFLSRPQWDRTREERAAELQALADSSGVELNWSTISIEGELRAAASELVRDLGSPAPGYAAALARAGRPFVDVARRLDRDSARPAVGIEVIGQVEVPSHDAAEALTLHFRADRVERTETGLRWIDFKTGKPFSDAKTASTRERHLRDKIRKGETLQAAAYAHSRGGTDAGSYLFLRPDQPADDSERTVTLRADDEAATDLFQGSVQRLAHAWLQGTFLPRLSEPHANRTPQACERCDVAEACLQGDSGSRLRLRRWFTEEYDPDPNTSNFAPGLNDLWFSGKEVDERPQGRKRR